MSIALAMIAKPLAALLLFGIARLLLWPLTKMPDGKIKRVIFYRIGN